MEGIMVIYLITNKLNGLGYVGQTKYDLVNRRYSQHLSHAFAIKLSRRRHTKLYEAMRKYGRDNFEVKILEEVKSEDLLNEREKYWIAKLGTLHPGGYNLTEGGDSNPMNNPVSLEKHNITMAKAEVRKAISDKMKAYIKDNPNSRIGRVPWNKGLTKVEMEEHSKAVSLRDGKKREKFRERKKLYRENPEVKAHRRESRRRRDKTRKTV